MLGATVTAFLGIPVSVCVSTGAVVKVAGDVWVSVGIDGCAEAAAAIAVADGATIEEAGVDEDAVECSI